MREKPSRRTFDIWETDSQLLTAVVKAGHKLRSCNCEAASLDHEDPDLETILRIYDIIFSAGPGSSKNSSEDIFEKLMGWQRDGNWRLEGADGNRLNFPVVLAVEFGNWKTA